MLVSSHGNRPIPDSSLWKATFLCIREQLLATLQVLAGF